MLKSLPKILIITFLAIFIFQLACLIILFAIPQAGQAAAATFKPQVKIPGMDQADAFGSPDSSGGYAIPGSTASIAKYIRVIYKYAIGIVGILAAVVLMVGGVMWIVAGGNATAIGEAKAWIGASLTGLLLALMSYLILATVNPALVDFKVTPVQTVTSTYSTNFDANTPCGQQLPGETLICGSQCPAAGQKCEHVNITLRDKSSLDNMGAKNCMVGSDDWYVCSAMPGAGTSCCTGNDDSKCASNGPDYVCNMGMVSGSCASSYSCSLRQGDSGNCDENADCLDGFECNSKRCRATTATTEGVTCNSGNCITPLKCIFSFVGSYPGVCYDGSKGDPCCYNSNCQSKNCSRPWSAVCTVGNMYDYTCN